MLSVTYKREVPENRGTFLIYPPDAIFWMRESKRRRERRRQHAHEDERREPGDSCAVHCAIRHGVSLSRDDAGGQPLSGPGWAVKL
jgi:hypothetical protein